MLILYRLDTGEVVDNSGTNSLMPEGPPDEQAYVNAGDVPREALGLLRLHDVEQADLVQQILTQRHHVNPASGQVVLDGPHDQPAEPEPVPADPDVALAEAIASASTLAQLKAALTGSGSTVAAAARVKES